MLIAEIWKPPDVAQPHSVAQAGEEEVALVVPVAPVQLLLLLHVLRVLLFFSFSHYDLSER